MNVQVSTPEYPRQSSDIPSAPNTSDSVLELTGIGHQYGPETVLENINLRLAHGEVMALLGRSGCGKTTLLRIAAGLLTPSEGQVTVDFAGTAVVFQQPSLLPWKRLLDNIALGLKPRGIARAQRHALATAMAVKVGLKPEDHDKYPSELSGGMQSRAALARAFIVEPTLLLLDEPFSALDIGLRSQMQALLADHISRQGSAALMVTHDLMDAVRLAHQVVLMAPDPGRVLARFRIDQPLAQRDDAWAYQQAAGLLKHPLVRTAFDLSPIEPDNLPAAAVDMTLQLVSEPIQSIPTPERHGCG